ncbi:MAG: immunoglobulin domain-containing protein [Butyrivibrio sp.]|nr:immunoglobulin domain-containing protein [Butyrivibrio sp.]
MSTRRKIFSVVSALIFIAALLLPRVQERVLAADEVLKIITQPADVTVKEGENIVLSVEVTSTTSILSDEWYKDGEVINGVEYVKDKEKGGYKAIITIKNAALKETGSYYVVVTDRNHNTVTSNTVSVTVEPRALTITTQPRKNETVTEERDITLSVIATGGVRPFTYQWYKDGAPISDTNDMNFTKRNAALSDAGSYHVVVTDKNGDSVTSDFSAVTVNPIQLKITELSRDKEISEYMDVTLSVKASGSGELSYQWYKDGSAIDGANRWQLSINNAALSDAGEYHVVVTDKNGSVTGDPITVTVTHTPLKITEQSPDMEIPIGSSATLEIKASGSIRRSYQWYKDGSAIYSANALLFYITNAELSDAGSYTVVVTDGNDSVTSDPIVVTVKEETSAEMKPGETETKPGETETKPNETEAKPNETEAKPSETATQPTESETKPTEQETEATEAATEPTNQETKPTEGASEKHDGAKEDETGAAAAEVNTSDTPSITLFMVLLLAFGMMLCIALLYKKKDLIKK